MIDGLVYLDKKKITLQSCKLKIKMLCVTSLMVEVDLNNTYNEGAGINYYIFDFATFMIVTVMSVSC